MAVFVTTLSFLFSTPGVLGTGRDVPAPGAEAGGFLLKDVFLLGAALWSTGEAWRAARSQSPTAALATLDLLATPRRRSAADRS
jgi:uncharacterized membrane protein YkgB